MLTELDLEILGMEMQMGMRVQAMGRDPNELVRSMRALPPALISAYWTTDYATRIDGVEVVVRVPEPTPEPLAADSWAIITACNPRSVPLPERDNRRRQALLAELVALHDYRALPAAGQSADGSWSEPGLLVLGIPYALARAFGSCFGQHAVVFAEAGGPVELASCDGGP